MPTEITILALGGILLLVHVFAASSLKTKDAGADWAMGPRDSEPPKLSPVAGRLVRAQANYQETLPLAIIALLGVVIANRTSGLTETGGWIWLIARAAYLPIYAAGIKGLRTGAFMVSVIGLLMVLWRLLFG